MTWDEFVWTIAVLSAFPVAFFALMVILMALNKGITWYEGWKDGK